MTGSEKLRMRTKLGFGVGATAEGAVGIAFNTWNFLFYNQVLGMSGTLAGLAVTISLVLDGISEPVVGSISDRWRSKLGRRHPFLYAAALPLAISFYLLYVPPAGLSGVGLFLWFTLFATLHRQALTIYQIPHLALGAELTSDYHQRSVVMSYSTIFGVLSGAATYFYGWTWFSHIAGGTTVKHSYSGMAAGVALVSAVAIFATAQLTRDQIPRLTQPSGVPERYGLREMLAEIKVCLANDNYRNTLLGLMFLSATIGLRETIQSYVSLYFWELPADKIRVFGLASPPAFIIAFIATVHLHRRFDKRNTTVGALAVVVLASLGPITLRMLGWFPANGSVQLTAALMLSTFLFYGAFAIQLITILSMLADVADEHELTTGKRQEGIFIAARTFFWKMSSGFGHILAGAAVDLIAFPTGAKPGQVAHDVLYKLGILDGQIATIPAIIAMVYYGKYTIDRTRFLEIQRQLAERRAGAKPPGHSIAEHAAAVAVEPQPI
jgi:glycoside/pentoside/hexuronide:cation symporter, GPH family